MKESNPEGHENELVARARSGDTDRFEALVNFYERRIHQIAYRIVENAQDAEDVLQETFLNAFENLQRFRGESSFYTWTVQIAVNAALQRVNRRRRPPTVSLDTDGDEDASFFPHARSWSGKRTPSSCTQRRRLTSSWSRRLLRCPSSTEPCFC